MPYRPPLVPHETFVADPPELPVRPPGEHGLSALARAELIASDASGVTLKASTGDGLTLAAEVRAAGEGVLRVRLAEEPDARTRSARAVTLVHPQPDPRATVHVREGHVTITTGPLRAELDLDPWRLRVFDGTGRPLVAENRGEVDISHRVRTLPLGRSQVNGSVVAYHESFDAAADERFVGLGEKFTAFDKRGQRALMWNYDAFGAESDRSYKNVPFYLSSRGYGVLVDSGTPVEFDLGQSTHSCVQILVPDDLIDYYVLAGPTPERVLHRLDQLTGRPALPPKWAFGTWVSSGFFADSQAAVLDRAARLRADGVPCDVLHLDCYWQREGNWSDLAWDAEAFPDPVGMLARLREDGFRVCLWMNPYISACSPRFTEAAEHGYLLRRADGSAYVADVWHGTFPACGIVDFTNPEAAAWFQDLLRALLRQGVAAFKTDFGEGVPADAVAANGMTGVDLHNVYSLMFNDVVSAATREVHGYGLVWARASYLGGQRHSAQWSGDSSTSYPAMAATLRGGLSHGLSGIPFWSHDAGGFSGTPSPDLYLRWTQFAALSPLVRLHGTTSRLPWDFPTVADEAIQALRLRYHLMPYLYSAAIQSAQTGLPMLRALLVSYPDDPAAWLADAEYLLGTDLLVAPMINPDGRRNVYLPDDDWVSYGDGRVHRGGRHVAVHEPVERIPLFVRRGALIPVTEPGDTVGEGPFAHLTIVSWGARSGRTLIRDIDGDTAVTAERVGERFALTCEGPAVIERVAFAPVDGATVPTAVYLNGERLPDERVIPSGR